MQNDIRSAEIHNENLKNVQAFEQELRQARDKQELEILQIASQAQLDSIAWTKENINQIRNEDEMIVKKTQELKDYMANRLQENVQQLVNIIEEDINANREEMKDKIPTFINEYQQKHTDLTGQNTKLRQQIENIQLLHDQSKRLEIDLTDKHTALAVEVEKKINQFNDLTR
jgi:gas vesicle protein